METELFGIEQTNGSELRKVGALEEAHGGTLELLSEPGRGTAAIVELP